jgi:hypothetical protein
VASALVYLHFVFRPTVIRLIRIRCGVLVFCPNNTPWNFLPKVCYPLCIHIVYCLSRG